MMPSVRPLVSREADAVVSSRICSADWHAGRTGHLASAFDRIGAKSPAHQSNPRPPATRELVRMVKAAATLRTGRQLSSLARSRTSLRRPKAHNNLSPWTTQFALSAALEN
jgi:hypothetical protein